MDTEGRPAVRKAAPRGTRSALRTPARPAALAKAAIAKASTGAEAVDEADFASF